MSVLIPVIFIGALLFLAAGALLLRDWLARILWRRRNPPEKLAAIRQAFEQRLLRPDWLFYERHLQRPAPKALKELFADHRLLLPESGVIEYDKTHYISSFEPIDEQGLADTRLWHIDAIAFASFEGDPIYLLPGPQQPDTVYLTCHESGDTVPLAPDMDTFLERLRQANARQSSQQA